MALDTAAKRLSAVSIGSPWRPVVPVPDGTLNQGDRQTLLRMCAAVLSGLATALIPQRSRLLTVPQQQRSIVVPAQARQFDA